MIRKSFKDIIAFFTISNFERRAVFVLLFILCLVILHRGYRNFYVGKPAHNDTAKYAEVLKVIAALKDEKEEKIHPTKTLKLSRFKPNSDSRQRLIESGLPQRVVRNIINFRKSGGEFRHKEDLKKLYAVSDSLFEVLEAYVVIDIVENPTIVHSKQDKKQTVIDLNKAIAEDLTALRGVGKVLSTRIVKYREALGGFYKIEQLYEVYGLDSLVIDDNKHSLALDSSTLRKISINQASVEKLADHPYIDYRLANHLVKFRKQHGKFKSLKEIENLHYLRGKNPNRFLPYLDLK